MTNPGVDQKLEAFESALTSLRHCMRYGNLTALEREKVFRAVTELQDLVTPRTATEPAAFDVVEPMPASRCNKCGSEMSLIRVGNDPAVRMECVKCLSENPTQHPLACTCEQWQSKHSPECPAVRTRESHE